MHVMAFSSPKVACYGFSSGQGHACYGSFLVGVPCMLCFLWIVTCALLLCIPAIISSRQMAPKRFPKVSHKHKVDAYKANTKSVSPASATLTADELQLVYKGSSLLDWLLSYDV